MFSLNCNGRLLVVDKPLVMGILNITPDSFYESSRVTNLDDILQKAGQMINEGATILDIGGQSTRPGSTLIGEKEESERVLPVIEALHKIFPEAYLSVDTFYATVAKEAVANGASIVNDISAGEMDRNMLATVASLKVPYVCMHMKGNPKTMQSLADYDDVVKDVIDYFIRKTDDCKKAGIVDVIIDPGFGFAKTIQHNFQLLKNLSLLKILGRPILAGISRKSTIYKTLGTDAEHALNGTTVLNTISLMNGASILRVHDVKEAVEAVRLFTAMTNS